MAILVKWIDKQNQIQTGLQVTFFNNTESFDPVGSPVNLVTNARGEVLVPVMIQADRTFYLHFRVGTGDYFTQVSTVNGFAETTIQLSDPTAPPTPPPRIKSGAGVYYLLPVQVFRNLHRLRDRVFSKKAHEKLHPFI